MVSDRLKMALRIWSIRSARELVRRQALFQHYSVSAGTVGSRIAGQLGFLGLKFFQVLLPELQVLFGFPTFNKQLVNRLLRAMSSPPSCIWV